MYNHLDKLETETGVTITRLHPDKPFDSYMLTHQKTKGQNQDLRGYGWPRPWVRWCTRLKTSAIDKYVHSIRGEYVQCIGIAADEAHRCKLDGSRRYPLVEWGITEREALEYCYRRGFTWGGLYEHFDRVSCYCCALQGLSDLRKLRRHYPELWERMRTMDALSWNGFTARATTEELEARFEQEDRQLTFDWGA